MNQNTLLHYLSFNFYSIYHVCKNLYKISQISEEHVNYISEGSPIQKRPVCYRSVTDLKVCYKSVTELYDRPIALVKICYMSVMTLYLFQLICFCLQICQSLYMLLIYFINLN